MMKPLILLTLLALMFGITQVRAQVVLPDSAAVWYLQQNERVKILKQQELVLKAEIVQMKKQIDSKQSEVNDAVTGQAALKEGIALKEEELASCQSAIKQCQKEIRKYKTKTVIAYVVAAVVTIIALLNGH